MLAKVDRYDAEDTDSWWRETTSVEALQVLADAIKPVAARKKRYSKGWNAAVKAATVLKFA